MLPIIEKLQQAREQLTAPGASHEIETVTVNGENYRAYCNAADTLRDAINVGRQFGDKTFIVYEGERWSFDDFFHQADRMGYLLVHEYGINPGDRVAIAMRNYPEWMAAYVAIISIGAIVVPLNSWGQAEELEYGLKDAGARLVFCDQQRLDHIATELPKLGIRAIVARPDDHCPPECSSWSALINSVGEVSMPAVDMQPDDLVMIMYTSGTTGKPKGAASTHRAICQTLCNFDFHAYCSAMANPERVGAMMNSGFEPSNLLVVPLFHVSGCFAMFLLNIRAGRQLTIMYKWNPEQALKLIEQERITIFSGVPAMVLQLLESEAFDSTDTRSLCSLGSGGAACPPHLNALIEQKIGNAYAGTGYGMTETNATGANCTGDAFVQIPGTAGTLSPLIDIKTVDEQGRDLPTGAQGEIYVRGVTNASLYWNLPEASAETFRDGWVATGDVGYVDENNFLFVVDRIKDMVIRAGENIYPIEVEGCIIQHPDVIEVCVYGLPDPTLGEELAATLYCRQAVAVEELQSWIGERLAAFKIPKYIQFSGEPLPKNPSGKILKKQIQQAAAAR